MKVEFITYCNKKNEHSLNFEKSFRKFHHKYKILGQGEKWNGFMTKIKAYHKYLSKQKNDNSQMIVVLIDCYDVIACSDLFYSKLKSINLNKILVSSQQDCKDYNCIELKNWWKENLPKKQKNNHYANSGFILGTVSNVLDLLNFMILDNKNGEQDDQMSLCKYIEKYPNKIDIDINSAIIATVLPLDFHKYTIQKKIGSLTEKQIINIETRNYPSFIHTPGMACDGLIRKEYFTKAILQPTLRDKVFTIDTPIIDKGKSLLDKAINNQSFYIRNLVFLLFISCGMFIFIPKYRKWLPIIFILLLILISKYRKTI